MLDEDRSYFQRRAEEEIVRAQRSIDPKVVSFHYRLGDLYLDKAFAEPDAPSEGRPPAAAPFEEQQAPERVTAAPSQKD